MSVVLVRVDERLVHGQIVEAWVPFCRATSIIVASDEVKKNRIRRIAIESCGSTALSVKVEGIMEAVEDKALENISAERVIVIFAALKDLMEAYNNGFRFSRVNIGNIHHNNGGVRMITESVYVDSEDDDIMRNLLRLGIEVDIRAVPSDRSVDIADNTKFAVSTKRE